MLPAITAIVAAYAFVRLLTIALRQFPAVEKHIGTRVAVVVVALAACGVVGAFTYEVFLIAATPTSEAGVLP